MAHFCLQCGAELKVIWDERAREACPRCGWIFYPQQKLSAAGLIEQNGSLLLVRRAIAPWKDCWYLPAGYVEVDEDPMDAARREVLEETGLRVRVGRLLQGYFIDDDPRGNGFLLVYACRIEDGSLEIKPETNQAGFFPPGGLPRPLAGAGHDRAIQAWQAGSFPPPGLERTW